MRFIKIISVALLLIFSSCSNAQEKLTLLFGNSSYSGGINTAPSIDGLMIQDNDGVNPYEGFPWPDILIDGSIITGWKKSPDHASAGAFMIGRSTTGGIPAQKKQATVGGVPITNVSLGLKKVGTRVLINYQDDPTYSTLKLAWINEVDLINNFAGADFIDAGEITLGSAANYACAPFGKIIQLPSGKLLQPFYKFPIDGTSPAIAQFLESTDNGSSWSLGDVIASHSNHTYATFPDGLFSEVSVVITEVGATDATTKMVALLRREIGGAGSGQTGYYHYRSSDGGETWSRDATVDNPGGWDRRMFYPIYQADPSLANLPSHLVMHSDGFVYIFQGTRRGTEYTISYIKATPTEIWDNIYLNYDAEVKAVTIIPVGQGIDWGYPEPFIDYYGKLVVQYYAVQQASPKRIGVYQKVITP
jgi:hypothetical protein